MPNTEKPIGKSEKKRQGIVAAPKKAEQKKDIAPEQKAETKKVEDKSKSEKDKKSDEKKKKETSKPKVKRDFAVVNGVSLRISTKKAMAVCRFIRGKNIERAISDLEEVVKGKMPVPMKGEIPHQKGVRKFASGSGGYPKKTAEAFIQLLKTLQANANVNELETPIVAETIANIAQRPYGRFGSWRKKRTHVKIIAREKKSVKKNKVKEKNGRKKSSSV